MTSPWAPPGAVIEPVGSGIAPDAASLRLAPAGPVLHATWVRQRSRADIEAEAARETAIVARSKRPLAIVAVARFVWILATAVAIGAVFIDRRIAVLATGVAFAALVLWNGLIAVNVRRARPKTVYAGPPSASAAMLAWLVPVAGVAFAVSIARGAEPFTAVWFGDAAVLLVCAFVGALAPISLLARLATWAGDRPREWWQWLTVPVLSIALSIMLTQLFRVPVRSLLVDDSDVAVGAGVFASLVLLALPALVYLALGWRAMQRLEAAARMTWERRAYPEGSLVIDSDLSARLAASAYLATRPNG